MISCLNRPHELRLHIAGALTNGVSREEIREVFMQVAIYAGGQLSLHRPLASRDASSPG
jgi:4-carboxymuconolactone decarboxylase